MIKRHAKDQIVLVGVLKDKRDLRVLLAEHWYRIPVAHAPKSRYQYIAFYQPAVFGRRGRCIRYYARVLGLRIERRSRLLPDERDHPRAQASYLRIRVGKIQKLWRPIRNIIPRRVTFGFTTLERLRTARDILQLYDIIPIERMMGDALARAGIKAQAEYTVTGNSRRYRLDFAVFCKRGAIAIECDNIKAHAGKRQRARDRRKDAFLRRRGWTVLRFTEQDIVVRLKDCVARVKRSVRDFCELTN